MKQEKTVDTPNYDNLIKSDFEFRKWAENHQKYEDRLETIAKQKFISDKDEFEIKKIQKMKLALKDQMNSRLSQASA